MEKYQIVTTTLGIPSIRFIENGEIMHNPIGPWQEAQQLYINQMNLVEQLRSANDPPLVVFDVGLGAGTNALAALNCWKLGGRELKVFSFEKDLDLLRFALLNREKFPFLDAWAPAIRSLLEHGTWKVEGGRLQWDLRLGEFTSKITQEAAKAHCIFFEPYSPKVNAEMWSTTCFKALYARTHGNSESFADHRNRLGEATGSENMSKKINGGGLLATYSRATSCRAALLLAGYFVGPGVGLGFKDETTFAGTSRSSIPKLLGQRWLERLQRSHAPFPANVPSDEWPSLLQQLQEHPQFA